MMVCRILGSVLVASPQSVSGREAAPEEVSAAIVRCILGSLLLLLHDLFQGERIRQRSCLKPWCVAFWALCVSPPTIRFQAQRLRQGGS